MSLSLIVGVVFCMASFVCIWISILRYGLNQRLSKYDALAGIFLLISLIFLVLSVSH